ncbi:histidine kinase [Marinicrinis lubricantis]|uniref:Oxygen sensor histidine kinase NreB n=1 Tax=Marinicrinis lubricantis TaxID=2086470 RepID=A0ABW1IK22_9BACL
MTRKLWKINDMDTLLSSAVRWIGEQFGWPRVDALLKEDSELKLRARYTQGQGTLVDETMPLEDEFKNVIEHICSEFKASAMSSASGHSVVLPLKMSEMGVLWIKRETQPFSELEVEILEIMTDHISLAMEKIRLYEEWQLLLLAEERNRLARDLHDSVNQKLFSLSLMARGIWEISKEDRKETADAVQEIGQLAQEALTEMRSLIWQLRPYRTEQGIVVSLKTYAEKIGLILTVIADEQPTIGVDMEEGLWRIAQEGLNNIRKHSGTRRAWIRFEENESWLVMKISDQGRGFNVNESASNTSIGITSMKERVAELGGMFQIQSEIGSGTVITVTLPVQKGGHLRTDED